MSKAIVDTTILVDVLLNSGEARGAALKALESFDETHLPVYAIKEFKAGPLKNFAWLYNKLVTLDSYVKAIDALQRMSRTPKRYTTSTALQALKNATGSIGKLTPSILCKKYGDDASLDKIYCDEMRLTLRLNITKAWKKRRSITTNIICPLECYHEVEPYLKRGLMELEPTKCKDSNSCHMALILQKKPDDLRKMRDAIINSQKPENLNRARVLREIYRKKNPNIKDNDCRYLGDAVFVYLASSDTPVLTTNINDHKILADPLKKKVVTP